MHRTLMLHPWNQYVASIEPIQSFLKFLYRLLYSNLYKNLSFVLVLWMQRQCPVFYVTIEVLHALA